MTDCPCSRTVTLIPSWANPTGGSPYSFSNAHLAPLVSANHHSASRTLTTNQPSLTGVSPDPESSSWASRTDLGRAGQVVRSGDRQRRGTLQKSVDEDREGGRAARCRDEEDEIEYQHVCHVPRAFRAAARANSTASAGVCARCVPSTSQPGSSTTTGRPSVSA